MTNCFNLEDGAEGHAESVEVEITYSGRASGLDIDIAGYGDKSSRPGYGTPIHLSLYAGTLTLRVWADINQEEPTHTIDLEGARENKRIEAPKEIDPLDPQQIRKLSPVQRTDLAAFINRMMAGPKPIPKCVHGAHPDRCEMCATGMDQGGIDANGNPIE